MSITEERLKGAPFRLIILAACGFARTAEHLLTDRRSRDAIDVAERFVDGLATTEETRAAGAAALEAEQTVKAERVAALSARAARSAAWAAEEAGSYPVVAGAAEEAETFFVVAWAARAGLLAAGAREEAKGAATEPAWPAEDAVNQALLDCILP